MQSFHCIASFFPEICLVLCFDPHKHNLWRHQYLICILEETWISLGGKKILPKEKRHPSLLWKAFSISLFFNSFIFHFIGTLNRVRVLWHTPILNLREFPPPPPPPPSGRLLCQQQTHPFVTARSRDGAVVRALASHECGPGSIPASCLMWAACVFFLFFDMRVFLLDGSLVFLPPEKTNSNSIWIEDPHKNQLELMWLPL